MFHFILKNALTKKAKILLTALTIVISCTVGVLAINVSNQVSDGIIELSGGYDTVIGPSGSESQLAFNSMFFTDTPLGTIDNSYYQNLVDDNRVNQAIPFAQGDGYSGYKIVGTVKEFIENADIKYNGKLFDENFQAVIGSNIAQKCDLKINDTFVGSHGVTGSGEVHANNPYTVVGIMNKTNTNYDNVIFVKIDSVWEAHNTESIEEKIEHGELSPTEIQKAIIKGEITQEKIDEILANKTDDEEEEDHDHSGLTAILLKCKNPSYQLKVSEEYNKINGVQAIMPTKVLRDSLQSIDMSKQIVFALCGIIFAMSVMLLFIITLLTAQDLKTDIKLMRLLGISSGKICFVFMIQSAICSMMSIAISLLISKVGLYFINNISTGYGLVINPMQTYPIEYLVLFCMFVVTLIPVLFYIIKLFRKDVATI